MIASSTISLFVLTLAVISHAMEQKFKDQLLALHNDARANEGASDMTKMVWDNTLEREAQQWADGCAFEHQMKTRGENLAWDSSKDPEDGLIKIAFKAWFDEKNQYSYGQYSCGSSCHYTQLVWAKTRSVGCAMRRCAHLRNAVADAWYLVCFYDPKGNMNGEKPYQKGAACSQCTSKQTCDSKLCDGEPGPGVCEDKSENCAQWAAANQCVANAAYMKSNCQKSCGICKDEEGGK